MTSDLFSPAEAITDATPADGTPPGAAVHPPRGLLVLLAVELAASAALLAVGTKAAHLVGYAIAAVLVAVTAVAFRTVDRTRRQSKRYVGYPAVGWLVAGALVLGVALAAVHAYYFSLSEHLA